MIDAYELERMRADLEAVALPDTCNLLYATDTVDGQGGITQAWGTVYAGVPCRLDAQAGGRYNEMVAGSQLKPFHTYVLTLAHGQEIGTNYRAEVNGETFNVVSVDLGKSWALNVRAFLERV